MGYKQTMHTFIAIRARRRPPFRVAALLTVAGLTLAGCFGGGGAASSPGTVLWGDSFGKSVAPYLSYDEHVHGGSSPCDWIDDVMKTPAPEVAVMVFVGNKLQSCDYRAAARFITQSLQSRGSHVIWIAAPPI